VSLGRPQAADPQLVKPASYTDSFGAPQLIVRAKSLDGAQPMPPGPPAKGPALLEVPNRNNAAKPGTGTSGEPSATVMPEGETTFGVDNGFATDPWLGSSGLCDGGSCGIGGPGCCGIGGPGCCREFWIRAEYLLWKIRQNDVPALLTTSPPTSLGVIGNPGTAVVLGGLVDSNAFSGGRFTFGIWCDPQECFGLEGSFFFLGNRGFDFTAGSSGIPLLARPFFNADPRVNGQDAELVANPAVFNLPPLTGSFSVRLTSELWNGEINAICNICRQCACRTDLLFGGRYLDLHEKLSINENLQVPLTSPVVPGEVLVVNDHFDTHNHFYGAQAGVRSEYHWRCWELDVTGKVALGVNHEVANVNGFTTIAPLGVASSTFPGGLLTQPTNIGHYNRDRFSVVPEVGVNLSYRLNDHWRIFAGYNFLYWVNVARPGQQIDTVVNGTQLPPRGVPFVGPARPIFTFHDTDFWAHGGNVGVEYRF
jgi:hypothetical protein